jgi:fibronectin type 3 domain-containing protein
VTGQVSFFSNASTSPTVISLTGSGSQPVQHVVSLSWSASASQVEGYNIYRSTQSGSSYVRLNSSLIMSLSFTDDTVQSGKTYYYAATSVDSNNVESADSNIATATVP